MDAEFLRLYNDELAFLRAGGAEFAEAFPKIAGRLGMEGDEVADPYVERLMEGFAFMAARVQHKLQARFPVFTQHLLEQVYPHFLAPVPSMGMLRFAPDPTAGRMDQGFLIPRGTKLFSQLPPGGVTRCEFRTAQDVRLWPLAISHLDYYTAPGEVSAFGLPREAQAVLRLQLRTVNGVAFRQLSLRELSLHCVGAGGLGSALACHLLADCVGVVARPTARPVPWQEILPPGALRQAGLEPEAALLPPVPRSFDGYRLLQEYFALPARTLSLTLSGLADAVARSDAGTLELIFMLRRAEPKLQRQLGPPNIELFATPAVNLFEWQADRLQVSERENEHRIVADRLRGGDFEVHSVLSMDGLSEGEQTQPVEFRPFYNVREHGRRGAHNAFYTLRREQRLLSDHQRRHGARTGYVGSEVHVALVDREAAALGRTVRQLQIRCLCSNRDLPLLLQPGRGDTDLSMEVGAPVAETRFIGLPSAPRASAAHGETAWRLISHLTLNYLSLVESDRDGDQGAESLRELLRLYVEATDATALRQIDGIRNIRSRPVVRRLPGRGQGAVARGLEIQLVLDETAFEGIGVFPLASVLACFFAKYVTINAFTEMVLSTLQRGEVMRWPMLSGSRAIL